MFICFKTLLDDAVKESRAENVTRPDLGLLSTQIKTREPWSDKVPQSPVRPAMLLATLLAAMLATVATAATTTGDCVPDEMVMTASFLSTMRMSSSGYKLHGDGERILLRPVQLPGLLAVRRDRLRPHLHPLHLSERRQRKS